MPIVGLLKKFILGEEKKAATKNVPSIVRLETEVSQYWILKEVIGDGAFGNVYRAVSRTDSKRVAAAKAMELDDDEGTAVMVEVEILVHCVHPNIVQLYDAFTMGNRITLLLEYCGGGAVDSIMVELSRGLSEPQIQYVMKDVLKALHFLHLHNVIHRDVKAGNVLLTTDAHVKLADFGVSAFCKDAREERSTFIGTPYWMAPEVMLCETFPEKRYTNLADIWSFGITLIEMADQRPPYSEMNPAKVVFKVIKAEPPTLERPARWSVAFRDLIYKCLLKDPHNRPTAADLIKHAFFTPPSDASCVQRLICEMNAEQVTTELMQSDMEDEDDTSSSIDVASNFDAPAQDFIQVLNGDQERSTHNKMADEVSINSLPIDVVTSSKQETPMDETLTTITLGYTPQVAPSQHTAILPPSPPEPEELLGDPLDRERAGHSALLSALTDLDDALKMEESLAVEPRVKPSEKTPPPHSLMVGGEDEEQDDSDDDKTPQRPPRHNPSHNIKDILASAKNSPQSVCVRIEDEPEDSTNGVLYDTIPMEDIPEDSIAQEAYFTRPASSAHASHTFQQPKPKPQAVGTISLQVGADTEARSKPAPPQHSKYAPPLPAKAARSTAQSTLSLVSAQKEPIPRSTPHRSASQPAGASKRNLRAQQEANRVEALRHSLDTTPLPSPERKERTSRKGQGHRQMRAEFNVLAPEMTLVEVRRPASFPLSLAAYAKAVVTDPSVENSNSNAVEKPQQKPSASKVARFPSASGLALNGDTRRASKKGGDAVNQRATTPTTSILHNDQFNYFGTTTAPVNDRHSPTESNQKDESSFSTAPPPEPPVDYEDERRAARNKAKALAAAQAKKNNESVGSRKSPHRQTVTRKTRIYMVDGVQVTSTTHQVFGVKQDYELRKQQLHDLRRLQREEARQLRELYAKTDTQRNEQAKRFTTEKEGIIKSSDIELQALARTQKHQMKEAEDSHTEDMKQTLKRIQYEQERNLRSFRETLKHELKQMKAEVDSMPKAQRKDLFRMRKEQLDREHLRRESEFLERQQSEQEVTLRRVQLSHKLNILQLEKKFQQQKHAALRSREASEWDMEEKQTLERHILYKQELKDRFYLRRTQMLARHQRELEHIRKVNEMNEEEVARNYAVYKKRLPKDFRTESKTRIAMFKESLRISCQGEEAAVLNEKMRAFEEKEKVRVRNAMNEHEVKAERKLKQLRASNAAAVKELEEIHNEKRKILLEAEQNKLEIYEKEYEQVIADWKAKLPLRKQELEAQFAKELDELDAFYRRDNAELQAITSQPFSQQSLF